MREQTTGLGTPVAHRRSLATSQQRPLKRAELEEVYPHATPRSVVRYQPIYTDEQNIAVAKPKRQIHWMLYLGLFLLVMIAGWIAINALGTLWQLKHDDFTYGNPRTYQTDTNVGHGTQQNPLSHFIALNLHSQILVIELPGGDTSKARISPITTLDAGALNTPVTLSFRDINADGKLDMLVQIGEGDSGYTVFLFNNGSQFVTKL